MRRAPALRLAPEERRRLLAAADTHGAPERFGLRARIVLRAAEGAENRIIARELETSPRTVGLWRRRFLLQRVAGIERDAPRPGRPPVIPTSTIQLIVRTTRGRPPPEAARWSARRLAQAVGVSKTTVQRVWKAHRLEPWRPPEPAGTPAGARFAEKVTDLVGLYLNPPERAMAFSVDERSKGSALAQQERRAIAEYQARSRASEFRAFLQTIDRETPRELDVHLLIDHRLAPTLPGVRRWLVRHPRFFLHALTSDEGRTNLIDRWFHEFTRKRVRAGAFPSVARLHRSIQDHLGAPELARRPFVWVATGPEIRDRTGRARIQESINGPQRRPAPPPSARAPERPGLRDR